MSKIAVLDFDGVIADMTVHAQIARERAKAFALQQAPDPASAAYRKAASSFFYSEQGALVKARAMPTGKLTPPENSFILGVKSEEVGGAIRRLRERECNSQPRARAIFADQAPEP
jgi:hypothetical protein